MRHLDRRLPVLFLLAALPLVTLAKSAPPAGGSQPNSSPASQPDRGQQVFEQNCARCHNAPVGFSPRVAGTIARHMRVRASLSDEDYKALRRFLAP
jgi:mono/diheme cytochrome c family protein